jgi:hypothetical protein
VRFIGSTAITPDSATAIYTACEAAFADCGVYRVPLSGGGPVRLNPSSPLLGANQFQLSPDGGTVVYTAEQDTPDVFDLFAVPLAGGDPVRLSKPFPAGSTGADLFFHLAITAGGRVVYTAEQDTAGVTELYSVPLAGGGVTRLNPLLTAGGNVRHPFEFAGSRVFEVTPDGQTVVYRADQERNDVFELYRVPVAGGAAVRLHDPLPASGDVRGFQIGPGGSSVVFAADHGADGRFELLSVPVEGPAGSPLRLGDAPLAPVYGARGDVQLFEIAPDSPHVVFRSERGLRRTLADCSQLSSPPSSVAAAVTVNPTVLGPRGGAAPVFLLVGLVDRSDAEIDPATVTVMVNGAGGSLPLAGPPRTAGDNDEDGAPELRLRLRQGDIPLPAACAPVVFEVSGSLLSGEPFSGMAEAQQACRARVFR